MTAPHGVFIGSEWELGTFDVTARGTDRFMCASVTVSPIEAANDAKGLHDDCVTIAAGSSNPDIGESFEIPAVYIGAYAGDVDSGSNSFKKWFWHHKIARSLVENDNEPWTELCWEPISGCDFVFKMMTFASN